MAPRAQWKGFLKVAELTCPVALYTAASTSERVAFHTLNQTTGHRLRREFIDVESGKPVERENQVKGYEVGKGEYVVLEPEEIAAATPVSDKTLTIQRFVPCGETNDVYLDKPYYLAPDGRIAAVAFGVIREAMRKQNVAALAQAVLFRRMRTLLLRPFEGGVVGNTLHFNYEIRPAREAFDDVPEMKIEGEMLDLAKHIISTKVGSFDPKSFDDRYEAALAELVKAKMEGRTIEAPKPARREKVVDLMDALRQSAGVAAKRGTAKATAVKKGSKAAAPAKKPASRSPSRKAS
jgi:DNA end-binding protein Ku